jgi:uncharacterized membrane protein YhhN
VSDYWEQENLRIISKILLMPLLICFYLANQPSNPARKNYGIVLALACSWFGDIFLLGSSPLFFMLGLGSFLTAHIFYIALFSKQIDRSSTWNQRLITLLPFLIFVGLFLSYLNGYLNANEESQKMILPVTVYAIVIALMGFMSRLRKNVVDNLSYQLSFAGSLLFILSDSCIAINKFVLNDTMPFATAIIMTTYCSAQLLITTGMLKSYKELGLFPQH